VRARQLPRTGSRGERDAHARGSRAEQKGILGVGGHDSRVVQAQPLISIMMVTPAAADCKCGVVWCGARWAWTWPRGRFYRWVPSSVGKHTGMEGKRQKKRLQVQVNHQ
jgi:hypothetical protein